MRVGILGGVLLAALATTGTAATASPGVHAVTARCDYDGTTIQGVAVAVANHVEPPKLTLTCTFGAGPATGAMSVSGRSNVVTLTGTVTGYPPIVCASAYAVWPDGHVATYDEVCPL